MRIGRQYKLIIFFIIAGLIPSNLYSAVHRFRCRALDPVTQKKIFTCTGFEVSRNGKPIRVEIVYRLPTGKILAREKINFRKDTKSPDLSLSDARDGRREMIERTDTGFSILMQDTADAPPQLTRLKHTETEIPALTIPGLPQYISENWKKILDGERLTFYCAFPAQKKLLRLRGQYVRNIKYQKNEAALLRLQPDNFVYRWFSEPVFLTIRVRDRRLMRYQGLHYIRDPRTGGGSIVDLTFNW